MIWTDNFSSNLQFLYRTCYFNRCLQQKLTIARVICALSDQDFCRSKIQQQLLRHAGANSPVAPNFCETQLRASFIYNQLHISIYSLYTVDLIVLMSTIMKSTKKMTSWNNQEEIWCEQGEMKTSIIWSSVSDLCTFLSIPSLSYCN